MSNIERKEPYVYQPEPAFKSDGTANELIYGLAGPGTDSYRGKRFTKQDAEIELAKLSPEMIKNV